MTLSVSHRPCNKWQRRAREAGGKSADSGPCSFALARPGTVVTEVRWEDARSHALPACMERPRRVFSLLLAHAPPSSPCFCTRHTVRGVGMDRSSFVIRRPDASPLGVDRSSGTGSNAMRASLTSEADGAPPASRKRSDDIFPFPPPGGVARWGKPNLLRPTASVTAMARVRATAIARRAARNRWRHARG